MKLLALIAAAALLLSSCGKTAHNGTSPSARAQQYGGQVKVQQTMPDTSGRPEQIAAHLEALAASIPQVESAHCVVFGNYAVVGINVAPNADRARVDTIKYSVAEALRKDPDGANAIVTADMDLDRRLAQIREHIRAGRPVSGFADEMGKIIGRIIPQLPRDVVPRNEQAPAQTENQQNYTSQNL